MKNKYVISIIIFTLLIVFFVGIKSIIVDVSSNTKKTNNTNNITNSIKNTTSFNSTTSQTNSTSTSYASGETQNTTSSKTPINTSGDTDEIEKFMITATPKSNGEVDFSYNIVWKVLDASSVGDLSYLEIGLPNRYVSNLKAVSTSTISSISIVKSTYAKVYFKKAYTTNETVNFTFNFTCDKLYTNSSNMKYTYTPCWFNDVAVQNLIVRWDNTYLINSNSDSVESKYAIWKDTLNKGQKINCTLEYNSNYFNASSYSNNSYSSSSTILTFLFIFFIIICIFVCSFGGSYSSHRGFGYYDDDYYGGYHSHSHSRPYHSSSSRSSCASSSRCACACACAGGGRAGCSKKDFFGTKLNSKKIIKKL